MATTTKRGASTKAKSTKAKSASTSKKSTTKKTTTKKPAAKKTTTAAKKTTTAKSAPKTTTSKVKADVFKHLNIWNWVLAVASLVQVGVLIAYSNTAKFAVTTSYQTEDKLSGSSVSAQRTLFDINILYLLVAALSVTALMHVLFATVLRNRYEREVKSGVNTVRWIGYSATISLAVLTLSVVAGVNDLSTLLMIIAANVSAVLLAMIRETRKSPRKATIVASVFAALAPWLVIAIYLVGANKYGESGIDSSVYYLTGSVLVILSMFDINMYLSNKKTGRFEDYTYTERVYMLINFALCSAVAWQVFAALLK